MSEKISLDSSEKDYITEKGTDVECLLEQAIPSVP
jgi:hypothetical protein